MGFFTSEDAEPVPYGAVLFLDGKRVWGNKTFKGKGVFQGFKIGGGRFRQFTFSKPPELSEEDPDKEAVANLSDGENQDGYAVSFSPSGS